MARRLNRWAAGFGIATLITPSLLWAAMYRCSDASGSTIYTDSPAQLQQCTAVSPGNAQTVGPAFSAPPDQRRPEPTLSIATAVPSEGSAKSPVTIPVQRSGSLLVVQTQLNDSRSARLILDTGASHTILSHEIARDLGLLANAHVSSVTLKTAGGTVQAEMTQVGAIRVGEAEAKNVPVAIHDLPDAPAGIDGLLGLTFLQQFLVTLDTQKGELHLKRRE